MGAGFPFDREGEWLKAALHTHTTKSDGRLDPDTMVEHYEWLGFDVVAITDHWTLSKAPSNDKVLVITGAELLADPPAQMDNDVEILAIGIDDLPEDPGGDRKNWGPVENYFYKTFPDITTAAQVVSAQGGVSFIAHPYWSGMPLEPILAADGPVGLELFNASAERENGRGDSSYVWDLALERGKRLWGFATDDSHYPGFDYGDAWTMVRAAERTQEAFVDALRRGHTYASNGPRIESVQVDGSKVEIACSSARSITLMSNREHGWAVRADHRGMQFEARILERDDSGLLRRARFEPSGETPYLRLVVEDERGRKAWTNPL